MDELTDEQQAVELLQQLGLKEYEAKAFVALSRLSGGTAKEINEVSDVPRTRVYDATRVLESKGLIEIQHSNPQQFRAVPIPEAVETLRDEYEARMESLGEVLQRIESEPVNGQTEVTHEVWSLSGGRAISNRAVQLVSGADEEIVFVVGQESALSERFLESLSTAQQSDTPVLLGTASEELRESLHEELPDAQVFVSGLEWLHGSSVGADETEITRLLLVDRETLLVSTLTKTGRGERDHEQAVFGRGFDNGVVTIARRLMATGLRSMGESANRN